MQIQRFTTVLALAALLVLGACATNKVSPAPSVPSATPTPAPLPAPPAKPEPVSGEQTQSKPSEGTPSKDGSTSKPEDANPQTSEEKRVAVNKQLDDSLGNWDQTLKKEQGDLAKAREQRTADAGKDADVKGGEGVEDAQADSGVDPEKAAKEKRRGGLQSEADRRNDPKTSTPDNGAAQQGDVGEGRVDDIVGRQICEAAQRETDPELKEKLQKECQKYRDGTK